MAVHRGNRWTSEEDEQLRKLIAAKTSPVLISVKLKRSLVAIRMRLVALRRKAKRKADWLGKASTFRQNPLGYNNERHCSGNRTL